ncbi:MAG: alpha/beta hydrolase [Gammaproteobacteria bacterium]|nr:alpha/beta hydrolase [Gammaproteobacteria bacterium]
MQLRTTLLAALIPLISLFTGISHAQSEIVTIERFVPHISTAPANKDQRVGIYLRERYSEAAADRWESGQSPEGRVVLFVHGASVSSIPDFDLDYKDYSWMEYLAEAGFDTFAMDHTGYGRSPRPTMDNACNMNPENQKLVMPHPLKEHCEPSFKSGLSNSQSDWEEIETVVDYIRDMRGVDKVSLIGWSAGGTRTGGYTARNPDKVDKLFLYAPAYRRESPELQDPGVPMRLQTYETLTQGRWQQNVVCENQVDPGVRDAVWSSILAFDPLGAVWGGERGVMRVRTSAPFVPNGPLWNRQGAALVASPTMIVVGAQDNPQARGVLYEDLTGIDNKVLVTMGCSTHFSVWETTQYKFLHRASLEWLTSGTFNGIHQGVYEVDVNGSDPVRTR